jgi:pyruvate/2-oxoglutarate dehydrogenase complex dihydrolipoamide acyltransferase (E2) component
VVCSCSPRARSLSSFRLSPSAAVVVSVAQVAQEIRAPQAGTISAHHAGEGDTVEVGAKLFTLVPGEASAEQLATVSAGVYCSLECVCGGCCVSRTSGRFVFLSALCVRGQSASRVW